MASAESATYARIVITFWTDPKVKRRLTRDQKHLLLYFMTSPHLNLIGLYYLPLSYAANEAELPIETIEEYVRGPLSPFVTYDWETEEILVHRSARHQIGETLKPGDNRLKAVQRVLRDAHSKMLVQKFRDLYSDWPLGNEGQSAPSEAPTVAPAEPLSSPLPSPFEALAGTKQLSDTGTYAAADAGTTKHPGEAEDVPGRACAHAGSSPAPSSNGSSGSSSFAIDRMAQIANDAARKIRNSDSRKAFNAAVQAIVLDEDPSVWLHPRTHQPIPLDERPACLQLAVRYLFARERRDIRRALILALQRTYDPFPARKADVPEGSEAAEVSRRPRNGKRPPDPAPKPAELDQFERDTQRIREWEELHVAAAHALRAECEQAVDEDPQNIGAGIGMKRALATAMYRRRLLQMLNGQ